MGLAIARILVGAGIEDGEPGGDVADRIEHLRERHPRADLLALLGRGVVGRAPEDVVTGAVDVHPAQAAGSAGAHVVRLQVLGQLVVEVRHEGRQDVEAGEEEVVPFEVGDGHRVLAALPLVEARQLLLVEAVEVRDVRLELVAVELAEDPGARLDVVVEQPEEVGVEDLQAEPSGGGVEVVAPAWFTFCIVRWNSLPGVQNPIASRGARRSRS